MAPHIRRGNAARSKVRAAIEHVFAQGTCPMALCIRTIGITRAKVKIWSGAPTYNIRRQASTNAARRWHEDRAAAADQQETETPSQNCALIPPVAGLCLGLLKPQIPVVRGAQLLPETTVPTAPVPCS